MASNQIKFQIKELLLRLPQQSEHVINTIVPPQTNVLYLQRPQMRFQRPGTVAL